MRILLSHPDFSDPGGVAAYYRKIEGKFTARVDHFFVGKRPGEYSIAAKLKRLLSDTFLFGGQLVQRPYDIIQVNPSFDSKSLIRDGFLILMAKFFRKKIVVFIRGWQKSCEQKIADRWLWLFKMVYWRADAIIVLSKEYKRILKSWGCPKPIHCEFTILDDDALIDFDMKRALSDRLNNKHYNILFIARLTDEKGVCETIEAVSLLSPKIPNIELIIAGDGPAMADAKNYAASRKVKNVQFLGYITGNIKKRIFQNAHLLCYPTDHGEGMPNTVVESMGFGLPIVTRSVGGVKDFFINRIHGFITHRKDPQVFADLIEILLKDTHLYCTISTNNYIFSHSRFKALHAAQRLQKIYEQILSE